MSMKRTVLAGGLVILAVGTLAMAQMMPPDGGAVPAQEQDSFFGSIDAPEPELKELLEMQAGMSKAERQAEEDYLNLDLGPDVDVSGIERVPSANDNQPYRTCEKTPEMQANLRRHGDPGDRAYRDISGYLSVTNVIATKDCTCAGKVIPHEAVTMFEDRLRDRFAVEVLEPKHTSDLYNEYDRQLKIVTAMCGEY
jgi:hypothetical protein